MKGIIFDIKRFAVHDGPGIRVTVFLKGCPLWCWWCHNPESISPEMVCVPKYSKLNGKTFVGQETIGREISVDELMVEIRKERVFMEESAGGATFSGGEPLLQHRFLLEMLKACKVEGIHTVVDTSAYSSWETLAKIVPYTDLFLIDLKLMNNKKHLQYTGVPNTVILENIQKLVQGGSNIRIRIPVIPGITDAEENITQSISFLNGLNGNINGVDLLPYHSIASHKYKRLGLDNRMENTPKLNKEDLTGLKQRFEAAGFRVKIGG
jgi:pyruvate formate lyase activating enzyme